MKFLDEFRDEALAGRLVESIRSMATRRWVIMEVCGGQTHSLLRHGIDEELADVVELIHGPGCPVCVTDSEAIDFACAVSRQSGTILATFADMLRVPGQNISLMQARAAGGQVVAVYSALDAVQLAVKHPEQRVIFFAVGFETTAPSTALAVRQAEQLGLSNLSVLMSHVRVLPAMERLMALPGNRVEGFLAAGHVCVVTGFQHYETFSRMHRVPVVVTGFEPVDLLYGIREVVRQLEEGRSEVVNCYGRSVQSCGNADAQKLMDSVMEPCDLTWRGFGLIASGGFRLREQYRRFDARVIVSADDSRPASLLSNSEERCRAGLVLAGQLRPCDCPEFGNGCTPDSPLGSPMVSSEGACAAYFRYRPSIPATRQTETPGTDGSTDVRESL